MTRRNWKLRPGAFAGSLLVAVGLTSVDAAARVDRLELLRREPFAGGVGFGATGAYERLAGRLHFTVDPNDPANARIVDLAHAPRDGDGRVSFSADFLMLKPVDMARGNRRLLYEVNNRGNIGMLDFFNEARWSNDPRGLFRAGSGFLMEQGYTLLWSGWNWDVLPGNDRLQIELPIALGGDGLPLSGTIAAEIVTDAATDTMPVAWGNSRGYPAVSLDTSRARLTVREEQRAPRRPIPWQDWQFAPSADGVQPPSPTHIQLRTGFTPGAVYELVYEATDARVVGLGLAAIRDAISFFRFDARDRAGVDNPLAPLLPQQALIFGISQSGRVIQHMLVEALHVDEASRMVFDAALVHVAGGGKGSFNHRFAQTTRHPSHHQDHQYPADVFPFTTTTQTDSVTGRTASVLDRVRAADALPRVFYTQTSTEYWTRSASLIHTDVGGEQDAAVDPTARIYVISGAQHGNYFRLDRGDYENCGNPLDHRPVVRALLVALERWASANTPPPPSVYPHLSEATLGSVATYDQMFPSIPGVRRPTGNLQPPRLDLGPRFADLGIADNQPPAFGPPFITRVSLPDADGNDLGGIRLPLIAAPVGTHTGWNLRRPGVGAADKLGRWSGSFIPFARTEGERLAAGDPRPSLGERYASVSAYAAQAEEAARELVARGFMLEEDLALAVAQAAGAYAAIMGRAVERNDCFYMLGFR